MKTILLNPGPVTLSAGVREAATGIDLCHRETEFFDLQDRLRSGLLNIYGLDHDSWSAIMIGGSGTTAMEAMVTSLVPSHAHVLVIENGVYGERLSRLAAIHGISAKSLNHAWTESWGFDEIAKALESGTFTHVFAVHHETTTGRLNDVRALAKLCEQAGCDLLLDAVSSFGAEQIPFSSPALVACAATANKCLHGITGLCFVICRAEALEAIDEPRTLTLHLPLWAAHQARQSTPFTPSVNAMLALDQALRELEQQGGWKARQARYRQLAETVADELKGLGIESLLPQGVSSCVLRAYLLPEGITYDEFHADLGQHGFVIYSGQGSLASSIFRISTMGAIEDEDMERFISALHSIFDH